MSVLSVPATGHTHVYVNGDVSIEETAAIAPGVILQACGEGRIIIKAGACLGMGTVLTANQGTIEIGEGAILGAGVLIVGYGKISDRVCIGSASTIIETSVENTQLISPGSLLGDSSRQETLARGETEQQQPSSNTSPSPSEQKERSSSNSVSAGNGRRDRPQPDYWASFPSTGTAGQSNSSKSAGASTPSQNQTYGNGYPEKASGENAPSSQSASNPNPEPNANTNQNGNPTSSNQDSASGKQYPSTGSNGKIYGQTHIERLMVTLFPHKEHFKDNNDNRNNTVE
ncbi:MAG: transferase [Cyanobacteria bacterium SW_9_44_58]|nr:MAG: transferase [Cyanobacteria bacterium SW_9_44_58]